MSSSTILAVGGPEGFGFCQHCAGFSQNVKEGGVAFSSEQCQNILSHDRLDVLAS